MHAGPSQEQIDRLFSYYKSSRFKEFEQFAVHLTEKFPAHPIGWKALGVALKLAERLSESLVPIRRSIELCPEDPENHSNLGVTLQALGRFDEAEVCCRQAISLKHDYAEAHGHLGNVLKELGRLEESVTSYGYAITLKPHYAEAHSNMGAALAALGKLDEAEASYRHAIALKPNLAEPHANLGKTLKALGRLDDALESYRQLVAIKPDYAEAHCHLASVLNELGRLDESVASYEQAIALKPDYTEAYSNLSTALIKMGRLNEAEVSCRHAIAVNPDFAEAHHSLGVTLTKLGRLEEAEASIKQAIAQKPSYAEAHGNLGITLQKLGRLDEAEACCRQAIAVNLGFAESHNTLGSILGELNRLDEAEACYRQAVALKPNYAEATYNLGVTLKSMGRLEEAKASYIQAVTLKPELAEAHNNLGNVYKALGRLDDAISSYIRAINLRADYPDAYVNLGVALMGVSFEETNRDLYPILINLLARGNFVRPADVVKPILSLLRLDNRIEYLLLKTTACAHIEDVDQAIEAFAQLPLLHQLLRSCPIPDPQLEKILTSIRRVLLINLSRFEASPKYLYFLSTLSLQCFINEYVYCETEVETEQISMLEIAIADTIAQESQPTIADTLCLAAFRPLHHYDWHEQLTVLDQVPEVKCRLIAEPQAEKIIEQDLPVLARVEDKVSRKVRKQYEQNPFPRWMKLGLPSKKRSVAEVCSELQLQTYPSKTTDSSSPSILIAGCGTGQHSIGTASEYANCRVLAVDLSRASLAYAQRKTNELGVTNVRYIQADILKLGQLEQTFDLIESMGVLHHMDDPMAGWRILVDLLDNGGLMKIGLYSQLGRRDLVKTQEEIALQGVGTSAAEIKQFRQTLAASHEEHHRRVARGSDFFSLSTIRDLIFHVQEHRFTLPQIQNCLDHLGLKFCGFESRNIVAAFKKRFGEEADACDLVLWHEFEEGNPDTFLGMYQFWCQKV